ncbi:hypothetical protein GCM10027039_36280 [Terrabacter koreensis]
MGEAPEQMTRTRLKRELDELGVDPTAYGLSGGHPSEAYVLGDRKTEWVVYYSERGLETGLRSFPNEDLACRYVLELISRDASSRTTP